MTTTDRQVRIIMNELSKHRDQGKAAAKAGVSRQTAARYIRTGKLPSELKQAHGWRTRGNPFAEVWPEIEARLRQEPGVWIRFLFEDLQERYPGRFTPGQRRTLHRHVAKWRALHGEDQGHEVFFPQQHRAGEAGQTDFTHTQSLAMTLEGQAFAPLLCHFVLPYSNWEWACRCQSESLLALKKGVQEAVFRLGRVPEWHQTDNSCGATHQVSTGGRAFLPEYLEWMVHLGMKPRTTAIGKKEQNGTVEAQNGAFKRYLSQRLHARGSREFASAEAFDDWLVESLAKENGRRGIRLQEELAVMKPLPVSRMPEYREVSVQVSRNSTINVMHNLYSVPPRLMHKVVQVRIHEDEIGVYYGQAHIQSMPRLIGRAHHRVNYRHVIWSLVQKPGAFARYRYRDDLYPSMTFRKAYERLQQRWLGTQGDAAYLRILHLAASTLESEVQAALELLLEEGAVPTVEGVRELVGPLPLETPTLPVPDVDLGSYDQLLEEVAR
jgi:Mu transposase-like protein